MIDPTPVQPVTPITVLPTPLSASPDETPDGTSDSRTEREMDRTIDTAMESLTAATSVTDENTSGSEPSAAVTSSETENALLAAAIELQSQLDQSDTIEDASRALAHRLAEILDADEVTVCWRDSSDASMRCLATASADKTSLTKSGEPMRVAAAEELAIHGRTKYWPLDDYADASERGGMMAIDQYVSDSSAERFVGICLVNDTDEVCGVLMTLNCHQPAAGHFLEALSSPLSSKLFSIRRHQGGR
ncbi:MAG: membrane-fusion protein, partial [Rhodopirellula sp. JB044]